MKLVGVGEGLDDLRPFDPDDFARALVGRSAVARTRRTGRERLATPGTLFRPMFDALSDKLQHALGDLRGRGRLDEESVSKAMREIRLALLEADVNLARRQGVRRPRQGARRRRGRDEEPHARPGGREDRPRGADRDHGRQRLSARLRAARKDRDPARRAPGLGQDDRRSQARADAAQGGQAARRSSPPTSSAPPRSTSSSSSASRSRSRSTARSAATPSRPRSRGSSRPRATS